jgi:hypothetical protein
MELTGKIVQVLPEQSGTSSRGSWRKQEYIIEIPGDYPKQVCFMVWGDRIDQFGIQEGQELTIAVDLESREYNGRWYTDVKAWRAAPVDRESESLPMDEPPKSGPDDVPF